MTTTCTCRITLLQDDADLAVELTMCPMHEAAPQLLEAAVRAIASGCLDRGDANGTNAATMLRAAVTAAERRRS